jgi:hypothetical protein
MVRMFKVGGSNAKLRVQKARKTREPSTTTGHPALLPPPIIKWNSINIMVIRRQFPFARIAS